MSPPLGRETEEPLDDPELELEPPLPLLVLLPPELPPPEGRETADPLLLPLEFGRAPA